MKISYNILITLAIAGFVAACAGRGSADREQINPADTISVPDTGFTGIRQYFSNEKLFQEVTFRNGIRQGLTKGFYQGGQLRVTFWYENGIRQDSSKWYYTEGQLFRSTPYKNDTIDGIQVQYYRDGRKRARIGYEKGLRTPFLEEYERNGRKVQGYPEIVVNTTDDYSTKGSYRIDLSLSDNSKQAKFFRGEFIDGRYDTTRIEPVKTTDGKATIILRKTGTPGQNYIGIISEKITNFGNKHLGYKRIDLPYNDLK